MFCLQSLLEGLRKPKISQARLNLNGFDFYIFRNNLQFLVYLFVLLIFQSRELFCQLIEHMKTVHSNSSQTDLNQLSVFVGTWNMGK